MRMVRSFSRTARAIAVLAHEAWHLRGVADEVWHLAEGHIDGHEVLRVSDVTAFSLRGDSDGR